jgi:hypothetical protein
MVILQNHRPHLTSALTLLFGANSFYDILTGTYN